MFQTFQYLKELFYFSCFASLIYETKADAKIIPFPHSIQIFSHLFSNFFFRTYVSAPAESLRNRGLVSADEPRTESGCKDKDFLTQSKFSGKKIGNFFSDPLFCSILKNSVQLKKLEIKPQKPTISPLCLTPRSLIAGAKITPFLFDIQNFLYIFFKKNNDSRYHSDFQYYIFFNSCG